MRAAVKRLGLAVAMLPLATAGVAQTPSAGPRGQYEVTAAPRNPTVTNSQGQYRPDDPQLVDRLVSFTGPAVAFDGDAKACARTATTSERVQLGRLLRRLIPDERKYGRINVAKARDYGIGLAPTTVVTATRYRCLRPVGNHGADWNRAVAFPIGGGRFALSIVQDHLLILRPVAGPVRASFGCGRARSPSERAICADRRLAGWDRSVAAAFREGQGDAEGQRAWLVERDRCGADRECLHESMSLRANNLLG